MKTKATFHKGSAATRSDIRRLYFPRTCSIQPRHIMRKAELILSLFLIIATITNIKLTSAQALVGSLDGGEPYDVVVVETLAFVADQQDRLHVIDVANPLSPQLIGSLTPVAGENGVAIAVSGNYAYVAVEADGLLIIDISSPTKPSLVGQYRGPYAKDVTVAGDFAYIADQDLGLRILNISDPSDPRLVSSFATQDGPFGIAVADSHAYIADDDFGLFIVNVADPANPALAATVEIAGSTRNVAVRGNHVFLADNSPTPIGFRILDVSDPSSPTIIGTYETSSDAGRLAINGNVAYVSSWPDVEAIDISDLSSPRLINILRTTGWAQGLAVAGDYLYVADATGFRIFQKVISLSIEEEVTGGLPDRLRLGQNFPNPFNSTTRIAFDLPQSNPVTLKVYDLMGQEVATLTSGSYPAGQSEVLWNAKSVANGVYLYRLQVGGYFETKRLILIK